MSFAEQKKAYKQKGSALWPPEDIVLQFVMTDWLKAMKVCTLHTRAPFVPLALDHVSPTVTEHCGTKP